MNNWIKNIFVLLLVAVCFSTVAQTTYTSEEDLKKDAKKLFDNEEYVEAYPLYSQLLSVYPKDPNYNYRFGICMLYTSDNKEKPISYLEYAAKQPDVEKDVFFFLGKAYHLNYRFDEAIAAYNKFKKDASAFQQKKLQVDKQIDMCRNGKTLLKNITDLQVLESKQVSDEDFFRSYDLSSIGGKLLSKPEDFQTSLDKKAKNKSIIYLAKNNSQIYYSSYGTDGKNGKDIYMVKKMPNGELSAPISLGATINTEMDEDYPFLHPNGKVLYFCSKGHNSMGGYDIYKSTMNASTGTWGAPVNLDFSINTPDDDIMYVTDSLEKTAYFSSRRASPSKMIEVYKINTDRRPVDVAVINGTMAKDDAGNFIQSKITVKNTTSGELIGIYNSDPTTGAYSMTVNGGAKLLFTVEAQGYPTQSEIVVMPSQQVFKPFRQEISYAGADIKMQIKNYFDEAITDNNYLLALNFIKEKARMEVNANEAAFKEPAVNVIPDTPKDSTAKEPATVKSNGISNNELVKIAYQDAEDTQKEAKELKNDADVALAMANDNNKIVQAKYAEVNEAAKSGDNVKADELKKEADKLSRTTVATFNLAKKLQTDATTKQDEADLALNYAKELEAASKSNSTIALQQLDEQKKRIDALANKPIGADNASNALKLESENKSKEAERLKQQSETMNKDIIGIENEIKKLNDDIAVTSNDQLKEGLKGQIQDLEEDKANKKKELIANDAKIKSAEAEAANLKNEAELVNGLIEQVKSGEAPATTSNIDVKQLQEQVNGYQMNEATNVGDTNPVQNNTTTTNTVTTPVVNTTANNVDSAKAVEKPIANDTIKNVAVNQPATTIETTAAKVEKSYDKKYEARIAETNDINDGYTRETTKASYYKTWADSITVEIDAKKKEYKKASDEQKKSSLQQEIITLQQQADEKNKLAADAKIKAKEVLTGVIANPTEVVPVQDTAKAAVNAVAVVKKDSAQALLVTNNDSIKSNTPSTIATNLPIVNDSVAKTTSTNVNNNIIKDTTAITSQVIPPVEANTTSNSITNTTVIPKDTTVKANSPTEVNATVKDTLVNKTTTVVANVVDTVANKQPVNTTTNVSNPVNTTNVEVPVIAKATDNRSDALAKSEEKAKEAQDGNATAMTMRSSAYQIADPVEREEALKKAKEVEQEAMVKLAEAATVKAEIAKGDFQQNDDKLDKYAKALPSNNSDDVMMAEMMRDESKYYFDLAQKSREKAASATSYSARQEALNKAEENEKIAIEKQKKSEDLYLKFKPDITTAVASNQPVVNTNTVPENAIATNQTVNTTKPREVNNTTKQQNTNASANQTVVNNQNSTANNQTKNNVTVSEGYLNPAQLREVQDSPEYGTYVTLKTRSDSTMQVSKAQYSIANTYQQNATEFKSKKEAVLAQIEKVAEGTPIPDSLATALQTYKLANEQNQAKADSVKTLAKMLEDDANTKLGEAELYVRSLDRPTYDKVMLAYKGGGTKPNANSTQTKQNNTTRNNQQRNNSTASANSGNVSNQPFNPRANNTQSNETFSISANGTYSDNSPIPIDQKLPDGLIFKVQIGAFKNPIPQNAFKGIRPLAGETTANGMIRYTAGLFRDLTPANSAKNQIKSVGYKDAFVVAFYNGKRISFDQAQAILNGTNANTVATNTQNTTETPVATNIDNTNNNSSNNNNNIAANNSNNGTNTTINNSTEIVVAKDIAQVSGLIYSIQIGVYSRPVTKAQLFNIDNIYTEILSNGFKRYTAGIYNDVNDAIKAKDAAVNVGVKDAFIVVFKDGKRVAGDDVVLSNRNNASIPKSNASIDKSTLVFKVQIGAYSKEVPIDVANKLLSIATKGVNVTKDENGITIYSVGNVKTYDEALKIKDEVAAQGLTDAFITAYSGNKRVNLDEAKKAIE